MMPPATMTTIKTWRSFRGEDRAGIWESLALDPCLAVSFSLEHVKTRKTRDIRFEFPLFSCFLQNISFTTFVDRLNEKSTLSRTSMVTKLVNV